MHVGKCWLCKNNAHRVPGTETPYFYCPGCDLIFIHQDFILDNEAEKERYSLHNNTPNNEGYVKMFKRFIDKAVTPYAHDVRNGLDFGCGPVPVLSMLLSDVGIEMEHYDPYFFTDVDFTNKRYDLITSTEVFEHLRHPDQILSFLKEHLATGGLLAVMTHFHGNSDFETWWYKRDPTHICFFSHKTFQWVAKHYNFKIIYMDDKNICVLQNCC